MLTAETQNRINCNIVRYSKVYSSITSYEIHTVWSLVFSDAKYSWKHVTKMRNGTINGMIHRMGKFHGKAVLLM